MFHVITVKYRDSLTLKISSFFIYFEDTLQPSIFNWNCDTAITYLENDVSLTSVHFSRNPIL